jgi:hypothetical protein
MKSFVSFVLFCIVVLSACTDRDDNLEGVQIRVQNTTETTFTEVIIDSLIFADIRPDDLPFYQKYDGLTLPRSMILTSDSLSITVNVDSIFEIDSTQLNLFTYRIKGLTEEIGVGVVVLKD